jgi:stress responsive alpha/beta barrel protein
VIHVLDRFDARPEALDALRELHRDRYRPGAEKRGMRLVAEWLAPGAGRERGAVEWQLLWALPDLAAWWGMRAQASVDPEVGAFWRDADRHLESRSRRTLVPPGAEPSEPPRRPRLEPGASVGRRVTAQLALAAGSGPAQRERALAVSRALPRRARGCLRAEIGANLPGTLRGGDLTLDLVFDGAESAARWCDAACDERGAREAFEGLVARVDAVHYAPLEAGLGAPGLASPVKRTLLLRVEPDAPAERVARFERELAAMPDHVTAIRNWHFARVHDPRGRFSHVWAQEFARLEGLEVDYMVHPYHWAYVDRWFDPESCERVVAQDFAHVYCTLAQSVLG